MAERFDVIVVGARCAGSPLATLLAREGLRVVTLERAEFPRDTLSTHVFQAQALAFLDRLGVAGKVGATGAPFLRRANVRQEHLEFIVPWPEQPGDVGGITSVRRFVLDPILVEAAAEAGAQVRMGTKVTDLVVERGRVTGVRVATNGAEGTLEARLVVGADGRNSTVANLTGSRKYNLTPGQRFAYWGFFADAELGADPTFLFHRWSNRMVVATPCDSGLYQVVVIPDLCDLPRFRQDLEGSFMEYARSCRPVAEALSGASRVGRLLGIVRWEGFFREAAGPGWVLVGDAGHFKDPTPGQGIQDAFRQVDALAPRIVEGLRSSDQRLDHELAAWARWRDEDATEHYWFATDQGRAGALPVVLPEIVKRLLAQDKTGQLLDVFNHRARPSSVLTPRRLLGATGRLLVQRGCNRYALIREVGGLVVEDTRRRRLNRRPEYVAAGASTDSGATEVPEAVAAPD